MTEAQSRGLRFAYFVLGITLPILGVALWTRDKFRGRVDRAHDITVEDSFPASDPPSAW